MKSSAMKKNTNILGVNISNINYSITLKKINHWIKTNQRKTVFVSAVHLVMECQNDNELKRGVNNADLVTPDGMPLVWLSKLAGSKNVSRVYGPDLTIKIISLAKINRYSVFLLGGAPGQSKILKEKLEKKFNKINIVGAIDTPIRPIPVKQDKTIIKEINKSKANIVFVGLGCPYQEKWIINNRKLINSQILIGVGAAFDFITGEVKQAPKIMQSNGFEWLFRLTQDPKRLWKRYTITNAKFIYYLIVNKFFN